MKKLFILFTLFISVTLSAQNIDTVSANLTLRAQDWAWLVGSIGTGGDSTEKARIRQLRTAMIAQAPATWNTNVTINNVPGRILLLMYHTFISADFGEMMAMGTTNGERTTIYTNIRAINNSALQYYIGVMDSNKSNDFINRRQNGKYILLDN